MEQQVGMNILKGDSSCEQNFLPHQGVDELCNCLSQIIYLVNGVFTHLRYTGDTIIMFNYNEQNCQLMNSFFCCEEIICLA